MTSTEQYYKIIDNIIWQNEGIRNLYDIQPNRIILGKNVYDILLTASCSSWNPVKINIEIKNCEIEEYVMGLPVTVDYRNKWLIEVCYGSNCYGKDLLYPNEKSKS